MGEIADMMINGLMCEGCGEYMDDHDEPGYPRRCESCARQYERFKANPQSAHHEKTRMVRPNQEWTDANGHYRVMAVAEKYAMCRRKGAVPFIRHVNEIHSTSWIKGSRP